MRTNLELLHDTCVVILVINKLGSLGRLSIKSISDNSNCDLIVGYVNERDVDELREIDRIKFIQLEDIGEIERENDFTKPDFFRIVAKKWELFQKVLNMHYNFIVYSDTDVYWLTNPLPNLISAFSKNPDWHLQIQSDTRRLDYLVPCMGFLAMRNTTLIKGVIEDCKAIHERNVSNSLNMVGDDEVMREYVNGAQELNWYRELPQSTYPVGVLLSLYSKKTLFRGMPKIKPYIFHANYTVGEVKKHLLLSVFMQQYSGFEKIKNIKIRSHVIQLFLLKRIKRVLSNFRRVNFK